MAAVKQVGKKTGNAGMSASDLAKEEKEEESDDDYISKLKMGSKGRKAVCKFG